MRRPHQVYRYQWSVMPAVVDHSRPPKENVDHRIHDTRRVPVRVRAAARLHFENIDNPPPKGATP